MPSPPRVSFLFPPSFPALFPHLFHPCLCCQRPRHKKSEGMDREFMAGTQHSGVTGGIVRAKLWQCGQTPDIRRIGCELGELAAYPQIGSNDPRHTRCRAAPRWIMTGADEKVAGRPSRSSATPLPRRSWKANHTAKTTFHPAEI